MFERERDFQVGDKVYTARSGSYGNWHSGIQTIVRTTHNGKRFVTDRGIAILGDSKYQVGEKYIRWHLYTPDVQAQWDEEDARRNAERRIRDLDIPVGNSRWRYMTTSVLVEIADFIEQRLPRKDGE